MLSETWHHEDAAIFQLENASLSGVTTGRMGTLHQRREVLEEVEPVAAWISPVPGGVGPMTRAMLLHNALQAARGGLGE